MAEESTLPSVTELSDDDVVKTPVGKTTSAMPSPSVPKKAKLANESEKPVKPKAKALAQKKPATARTVLKRPAAKTEGPEGPEESGPLKRPATVTRNAEHGDVSDGPTRAYKEFRSANSSYSIRVKKGDGPKRELFRVRVECCQVIFGTA